MKAITYPKINLKTTILAPLALALMLLIAGFVSFCLDQEREYTKGYVGDTFSSVSRIFDSAIKSDTATLSSALELITRDDTFRHALIARDQASLLRLAEPIYKQLHENYGITHFYFTGSDRVNLLRVHQPERYGDKIGRVTTSKAQVTGKPAAGLELGPLGTFTLRVVFPWYDGERLIGFVELGEEIEHILKRIKEISGTDLYVAIDKQFLSQNDWIMGMQMLGRHTEWDFLPDSVVTFQTIDVIGAPIHDLLSKPSSQGQIPTEMSYDGRNFQSGIIPLSDVSNRKVGSILLLQDITARITHSRRDLLFSGSFSIILSSFLFGFFYLLTGRVENRLATSKAKLVASEQRFRTLVESSSDWIWEVNVQGIYTYVSPKIYELLGYTPEEILGMTPFDLMPPGEAERARVIFNNVVASQQPCYNIENINLHKDGRLVVLETNALPIIDSSDSLVGFRGMDRDITARKEVELALRESEVAYRTLAENLPGIVYRVFLQEGNRMQFYNKSASDVTGYEDEELITGEVCGIDPLITTEDRSRVIDEVKRAIEENRQFIVEYQITAKDGSPRYLLEHGIPVCGADDKPLYIDGVIFDNTKRKLTEKELQSSEANLAEAQRIAKLGSWDWDIVQNRLCWSNEAYRIFGVTPSQACVTYEIFLETVHPHDREAVQNALNQALQQRKPYDIEYRIVHPDSQERLVHARGEVTVADNSADPHRMIGTVQDITEQKMVEMRLRQAAKVFENTSEGVIITGPDRHIVAVNEAFTRITGYSGEEVKDCTPKILRSGRHDEDFYQQMWAAINTTGRWQGEIWNRRKDGVEYPEWLNISEVRNEVGDVVNYIGVFADIGAIKESQGKLEYTANHDALTGLPNRLLFHDRLEQGMAIARRAGKSVALLFIDLDRFKVINDTLGHEVGDSLLQEVASRLVGCLREEDTVARMGGDEFVVILNGVGQPEDAALLATRLLAEVGQPILLAGHEVVPGLSIGISLYPQDGESVSTLLKNADAAMYRAKDMGRNCYQYYSNELTDAGLDRLELESDLRQALTRREFILYYQPQVDLSSSRIIGTEALIRWQHPTRGMISPVVFIPIAEDIGLIGAIGEWVLHTACAEAKAWQTAGLPPVRVAVNVSGHQISKDHVVEKVEAALQRSGLAPQFLEIEVTESVVMKDANRAISTLNGLKNLGVALAIDDFGTGYSSLSYLKRFPIDKLKIDKSFVDGLPDDQDDAAIAMAIIAMAHSLKHKVIAEGVETEDQRAFLLDHGCDEMQGYLFSKPVPAQQFFELLRNVRLYGQQNID